MITQLTVQHLLHVAALANKVILNRGGNAVDTAEALAGLEDVTTICRDVVGASHMGCATDAIIIDVTDQVAIREHDTSTTLRHLITRLRHALADVTSELDELHRHYYIDGKGAKRFDSRPNQCTGGCPADIYMRQARAVLEATKGLS